MLDRSVIPLDAFTDLRAARFGVYVHYPYCLSKCPYCDFASTVAKEVPEERYTRAILAELAQRAPELKGRRVDSIFFGGGTPSLWAAQNVARVLRALREAFDWASDAEVTLEANPGASDATRFAGFREAGVNRLSLGVQSFHAQTLKTLGRAHDADQARWAYGQARAAGFTNVSMDFIYGVHGQSIEQVQADAMAAIALGPDHLSAYALTLDAESLAEAVPLAKQLERGEVTLPPDETVVQMQRSVRDVFAAAGLERYEVSNYAKPGVHSRHNALYWTGGEYLALGSGATGRIGVTRYSNHRSAEKYLAAVEAGARPEAAVEALDEPTLFRERLAMGLRLTNGIDVEALCDAFHEPVEARRTYIAHLERAGFARRVSGRLALTDAGFDLHSAISARLL